MLAISELTLGYISGKEKNIVIKDFSCELSKGSILAIVGPSGCGKTTLLKALAGLIDKLSGEINYQGRELSPKSVTIGYIPQSYGLLPWKNVRDNCCFCAGKGEVNEEELVNLSRELKIDDLLMRYPRELSGGQAQRVALARAFIMKPDLLLLDEPYSALDIATSDYCRELTYSLCQEYKTTAVIVTHGLEDAMYLADNILVMGTKGKVIHSEKNTWKGMKEDLPSEYFALLQKLKKKILMEADKERL